MFYRLNLFLLLLIFWGTSTSFQSITLIEKYDDLTPTLSFTFDDGSIQDIAGHKLQDWNQRLLQHLQDHQLQSILFTTGFNKQNRKGAYVLSSWNKAGHKIANHSFSHPNFSDKNITIEDFKEEILRNDSIINKFSNYYRYFRFPFLKEGHTKEKIEGYRKVLHEMNYKNGHVSIDASDWYIEGRLIKRLTENPKANLSGYKTYYMNHLYDRAVFYDSLAFQLTGRRIPHVLLLHHNLSASLFLGDLITHFKEKGWNVINASKAYEDKIYDKSPETIPAGESIIWALAKKSGKFENVLRYPAEDGKYEKPIMDKLGL